jgi:hypothetical protein
MKNQKNLLAITLMIVIAIFSISFLMCNPQNGGQVFQPEFSPAGGTYSTTQYVIISCATPGATIYYTTDGTIPYPSIDPIYSGPITVSSTKTIKAIATNYGMQDSQVASATYTISAPSITVTEPNSSTEWFKGDYEFIEWTSTGSVSNIDIDLYRGTSFVSTIAYNTANDGSHLWSIPTSLTTSTLYKIKMWHLSSSDYIGESSYFTISESVPQYGTLKVVNNSIYNIDVVKWKVAGTSTYGVDQLTTILYNGNSQDFVLQTGSYDVKVESTSSSVYWEFTNRTISANQTTTLTCNSKPSLTVVNNSVNPDGTNAIHELYLRTTTYGSWGTSYLPGSESIYDAESKTITGLDPNYYYMKLWHDTLIGDDVCIYITVGDLDWGENETINVTQNWGSCID